MKKSLFLLFSFCMIANIAVGSGRLVQPPLFSVINEFDCFVKAQIYTLDVKTDSLKNTTVFISLWVHDKFGSKMDDIIHLNPITFNEKERHNYEYPRIFMDLNLGSLYYMGLKKEGENQYVLSPSIFYNKIKINGDRFNYRIFNKMDYFLAYKLRLFNYFFSFFNGRTMNVEVFEKKLNRRLKKVKNPVRADLASLPDARD
jgi:hypothetical protein